MVLEQRSLVEIGGESEKSQKRLGHNSQCAIKRSKLTVEFEPPDKGTPSETQEKASHIHS